MFHYAKCLISGFNLNIDDFTLEEQDAITFAVNQIKTKEENEKTKGWSGFFAKAVNKINKQIADAHKGGIK